MLGRAEVRRSLLAMGVQPRVVDSIVAALPSEAPAPSREPSLPRDAADVAAANVIADFERLVSDED